MAYLVPEDLIAEGVADTVGIEALLQQRIALAQATFEHLTGRFFERRTGLVLEVSGRGHDTLWLPIPPVSKDSITEVAVEGEVIESTGYRVVMPTFPDGRRNPKLLRVGSIWPRGDSNVTVTGDFGFVDYDATANPPAYVTPELVKRAVARIALLELPRLADGNAQRNRLIIEESLKDYSYRLREAGQSGYFSDLMIDNVIADFRIVNISTP